MRTVSALALAAAAQDAPTVRVINGTLRGARCPYDDVNSFLGIPYARPPVGDLRFAPPQPFDQAFDIRQATQPPPACIQFSSTFSERGPTSEDCLFVDVWAPASASPGSRLPVKVWLYGGSNQGGGISNPTYDGCTASERAIQVSINYRLGPLGFLALDSLGLQGNQGIQDQLLALRWVQDNIAAFGGDPRRVLLFGQSAGAQDAFAISSLPQAPSLMSAAILQSGAGRLMSTRAGVRNATQALVRALGCALDDVACVRAAPAAALNASNAAAGAGAPGAVVDGSIIPAQPLGAGVRVPAVIGTTADEGTLFVLAQYGAGVVGLGSTAYDAFLAATFGPQARRVREAYPLADYAGTPGGAVLGAMSAVLTHSRFRCPARRVLRRAAVPVWTYLFGHTPSCPWYDSIPAYALGVLRAAHTAEIPFVFNGTARMPRPDGSCSLSPGEVALAATMLAAWDAMAAAADPGPAWPRYDPSSSAGVNIVGDRLTAGTVDYTMCDLWDDIEAATPGAAPAGAPNASSPGPVSVTPGSAAPPPWPRATLGSVAAVAALLAAPLWVLW